MELFIYGTLLVPRIWTAVTGIEDPRWEKATLPGHAIFRVEGGDFPGIIEDTDPASEVTGRIVHDIDHATLRHLDAYEDAFYDRVVVPARTSAGVIQAQTYRIPRSDAPSILSSETWTLEWFQTEAEERYWDRLFG